MQKGTDAQNIQDRLAVLSRRIEKLSERIDPMDPGRKMRYMEDMEFLRSQQEIARAKLRVFERSDFMARMGIRPGLERVLAEMESVAGNVWDRLETRNG